MDGIEAVIVATKTASLSFGGLVAFYAARAYRRTGSPALRSLTVGLSLVVLGATLAGVVHVVLDAPLAVGVAIHGLFTAAGFATLAYSLYADSNPVTREPSVPRSGR